MKEFMIRKLLETSNFDEFEMILLKYKILDCDWKSNEEIFRHYEYLESLIPEELKLSNPIRYEFRKHSN